MASLRGDWDSVCKSMGQSWIIDTLQGQMWDQCLQGGLGQSAYPLDIHGIGSRL